MVAELRSIQRGTGTIGNGASSDDVTISAVDRSHSRLNFNGHEGGQISTAEDVAIRVSFVDDTTVRGQRVGTGTGTPEWDFEVIEEYEL